jgi:hypothetical protein
MIQMKNVLIKFIETVIIHLLKKGVKQKIVVKNHVKNLKNVEMAKMVKMGETDLMVKMVKTE